jgi:hypothetical protein
LRRRTFVTVVAAALLLTPSTARASVLGDVSGSKSGPSPDTALSRIVSTDGARTNDGTDAAYGSTLTITFDQPITSPTEAARVKPDVLARLTAAKTVRHRASTTPAAAGPDKALLHCNKHYQWSDSNGTFEVQHGCRSSWAPWGYTVSDSLCAIAVTPAREWGMLYSRNGVAQTNGTSHTEWCTYTFHGSFRASDYDKVQYHDVITFDVEAGGHHGTAQIDFYGNFQALGSPCSPTSC